MKRMSTNNINETQQAVMIVDASKMFENKSTVSQ
jgi:hypothetical protein